MRIDQSNTQTNISATPVMPRQGHKEVTKEVKTSSDSSVQKQNNTSTLKKQQEHHYEAALAAEKRAVENEHEVIRAIEKANTHIRTYDRRLEFAIHESTKEIMVKVVDTNDDSIIREIPSEKVLDMVAHLWEMAGILVDEHR